MIPNAFPIFKDVEVRNGAPDLAPFTMRLMQWEEYAYRRHLRFSPSNGFAGLRNAFADTGNDSLTTVQGIHYIPPPGYPARRLVARFYCSIVNTATAWTGQIEVTNSAGTVTIIPANYAQVGAGAWLSAYIPASGPDVLVVRVRRTSSGAFNPILGISSACMWWEPLATGGGVTVDTSWAPLAFGHAADGTPDSAYLLRWLTRKANQLACRRVRMAVASTRRPVAAVDGQSRYRVWVAETCSTITVQMRARATVAGQSLVVYLDGVNAGSVAVPNSAASAVYTVTLTGVAAGEHEIRIDKNSCSLFDVVAVETAAGLTLASGDVLPTTFRRLPIEYARARAILYADKDSDARNLGRRALVENMAWLWSKRTRLLIDDVAVNSILGSYVGPVDWQPPGDVDNVPGNTPDYIQRRTWAASEGNAGDQVVLRHYVQSYLDLQAHGQWRVGLATSAAMLASEDPSVLPSQVVGGNGAENEPPVPWSIIDLPYTTAQGAALNLWRVTHRADNSVPTAGDAVPVRGGGWVTQEVSMGESAAVAYPSSHPTYGMP